MRLGPPKSIAFTDGKPSKALDGFARNVGVPVENLSVIATERGEYMGFETYSAGRPAPEILIEGLPGIVDSMSFPKMMYWMETRQRFARPIRWILALFNGDPVPFELFGVSSGVTTEGHRILGKRHLSFESFDDYVKKLTENFVLVSGFRRSNSCRN